MSDLIECPSCKSKVSLEANACPKCGQPMTDDIKDAAIKKQKKDKKKMVGCLTLVILMLIGTLFVNDDDYKKSTNSEKNKVATTENVVKKTTTQFDFNLRCPNIEGLYLGMQEDKAVKIIKRIADRYNLNLNSFQLDKIYEINLMPKNSNNISDHVLQVRICTDDNSIYSDKLIELSFNQKFLDKMGYPYDSIFNNFVNECTSGEPITKLIGAGLNHSFKNHIWGFIQPGASIWKINTR